MKLIMPTNANIKLLYQDNLFVKETVTTGKFLNRTTGNESPNAEWGYSDYINVDGATKISVNSSFFPTAPISPGIIFYDENKTFMSGIVVPTSKSTISLPNGTKYIRYSFLLTQVPTLKISKGTVTDEKILIEGELGDYQEFLVNNYSTEETPIGKWIDGRTVYRKVFLMGALKNSGNTTIKHGITDLDFFIKLSGTAKSNQYLLLLPASHSTPANNVNVYADYTHGEITIQTFSDRTGYTQSYIIGYYVKNTN